jgi:hypothetical protein
MLIFVFDTGMWLTDGTPLAIAKAINYVSTTVYYIFNHLICLLWLMYTDYKIFESRSGLIRRIRFYAIPAAVNVVMSIASPFTGWLFIINEGNSYARGPMFPVMAFISLFYLVLAFGVS